MTSPPDTTTPNDAIEMLVRGTALRAKEPLYIALTPDLSVEESLTGEELMEAVRAVASHVTEFRGEPILLLYGSGLAFCRGFWGCLYAGAIPVPIVPPNPLKPAASLERLATVVKDSGARVVLVPPELQGFIRPIFAQEPTLSSLQWITLDRELSPAHGLPVGPRRPEGDTAYLQYTSGSTSIPKGVCITHQNILTGSELIISSMGLREETVSLTWLPLFHDMGLVAHLLTPMFLGAPSYFLLPQAFLNRPMNWLRAVSMYRATFTGAPNFAFELCIRRANQESMDELDLSTLQIIYCGAEPVFPQTMTSFQEAFASAGLRANAVFPCYGLAEATLLVTGGPPLGVKTLPIDTDRLERGEVALPSSISEKPQRLLVSSGAIPAETDVVIVDPETCERVHGARVGEIWVRGDHVAPGYWKRSQAESAAFWGRLSGSDDRRFLRTGDLGFLWDGQLFVAGRIKDVIIVRGRNHYPHDIERTVESLERGIRAGGSAAFGVERQQEEVLGIAIEMTSAWIASHLDKTELTRAKEIEELVRTVRKAVSISHDLHVDMIYLVPPRSVPKTSSGKKKHSETRHRCLTDTIGAFAKVEDTGPASPEALDIDAIRASSGIHRKALIEKFLRTRVAANLGATAASMTASTPLGDFGVDSLTVVDLTFDVETAFKVPISATSVNAGMTLDDLVGIVDAAIDSPAPIASTSARSEPCQVVESVPLLPGQIRVLSRVAEDQDVKWPLLTMFHDAPPKFDPDLGQRAAEEVVRAHGALRARFRRSSGTWIQSIEASTESVFKHIDASTVPAAELLAFLNDKAQAEYGNLHSDTGPVFKVLHFSLGKEEPGRLAFLVHHLAADALSERVYIRDYVRAYSALTRGTALSLGSVPYDVAAAYLRKAADDPETLKHLPYWREQESRMVWPLATLRTESGKGGFAVSAFSANPTSRLFPDGRDNSHAVGFLIEALAHGIRTATGASNATIGMIHHGRAAFDDDPAIGPRARTGLVGCFAQGFPITLGGDAPSLGTLNRSTEDAQEHASAYSLLKSYLPWTESGLPERRGPEAVFSYVGTSSGASIDAQYARRWADGVVGAPEDGGALSPLSMVVVRPSAESLVLFWMYQAGYESACLKVKETVDALIASLGLAH
ncbi:MAG: AMP-binding protein [Myxococcales bacterium]|nr:AMP-binding protein [Myxococcales bacterium]